MPAPETDDDIGRLFSVRPADFVGERNATAKKLKAAGRRDDAATVEKLPRPTPSVWAVNQIARQEPALVRRLAEATAALQGGNRGEAARYSDVLAAHRDVLKALRLKAEEILDSAGLRTTPDLLARVVHDLRAGISSPESRPLIESGRLVRDVADDSDVNPFAGAPETAPRPSASSDRRPNRTDEDQRAGRGAEYGKRRARATRPGPFSGDGSRTFASGSRPRGPRASGTNASSRPRGRSLKEAERRLEARAPPREVARRPRRRPAAALRGGGGRRRESLDERRLAIGGQPIAFVQRPAARSPARLTPGLSIVPPQDRGAERLADEGDGIEDRPQMLGEAPERVGREVPSERGHSNVPRFIDRPTKSRTKWVVTPIASARSGRDRVTSAATRQDPEEQPRVREQMGARKNPRRGTLRPVTQAGM